MLKLISIGIYYLSVGVIVLGILGALSIITFSPIAAVLLYLLFKEFAELGMTIALRDEV